MGSITVAERLGIPKVELDLGMGDVSITCLDARELDVDLGNGSLWALLPGSRAGYFWDVECPGGSCNLGAGHRKGSHHQAARQLHLECGLGDIQIEFEED